MPEEKKIKIVDDRKTTSWGTPLSKSRTGEYDPEIIRQISTAAIRQGIDPYTALAVAMQESGLGTYTTQNAQENWGQVSLGKWGNDPGVLKELDKNPDLAPHAVAMNHILKKYLTESDSEDEAVRLQGYNGYLLKPNNDIGATKMYGIDLTKYPKGYDLKKDPRYGHAVIDLRENLLKKNPELVEYVNSLMPSKSTATAPLKEKLKELFNK